MELANNYTSVECEIWISYIIQFQNADKWFYKKILLNKVHFKSKYYIMAEVFSLSNLYY